MKPYLTIEEIISMPRLSQSAVSQDGTRVAWVESTAVWDKNERRKHVQLYDARTNERLTITAGEKQSHSPAWSSSNRLAWLGSAGEGDGKADQIFTLASGVPVQLTHVKTGVASFQWAPDGKGLYFLAPDPERHEALKRRKERYGDFEYADRDHVCTCVYYLGPDALSLASESGPEDLRKEKEDPTRRLVGGEGLHILSFAVSPDNSKLAFMAAPGLDWEDREQASLYLLELPEPPDLPDLPELPEPPNNTPHLKYRELPVPKPIDGEVLFSPTGNEICYGRPVNEGKWYNITTLEMLDLSSGHTRRPLQALDEYIHPVRWTPRGLIFTIQQKTDWYVNLLDSHGKVVPLKAEPGSVTMEASASESGLHLATLTATKEKPFELHLNGSPVTNQSRHYQGKTLSQKKVVSWPSKDGTEIEGVLITPPDLPDLPDPLVPADLPAPPDPLHPPDPDPAPDPAPDRRKPRPLLVVVHGGPTWAAFAFPTQDLYYPYEQFIKRGFIILDVNYRGSSGYGEKFRKLNYRNLGLGDYEDVISGVDMLVEKGLADNERLGIMGWSQGGYISAVCATYSRRFKAASAGAGISNWYTYYANTDIPPFTRHYLGAPPWDDPEIYARTSPITHIKQAGTPTLIQHGDRDNRVPYANARELHRGLKDMGVPVQLVTFKGMGHGANKPGLHRAIMKQNYAWFCHHLLGDPLDEFWLHVEEGESTK